MRLLSLTLEQFRSYASAQVTFAGSGFHVFRGPNGAGKTNILEAIALLSQGRSCFDAEEADIVQWGKEYYRVRATLHTDAEEELQLEVVSQLQPRKAKACFIRDVRTPVGAFVGALPTVLFLPQDLDLFTGAPARRRDFLADLLCQVSPEYLRAHLTYQKILKQRNALLRKIAEGLGREGDLSVWDRELAREGALLTVRNLEMLKVLQCTIAGELSSLGEAWEDVRLVYDRAGEACELKPAEEELLALLQHYRERDLLVQSTTVGPHRHDWRMEVGGRSLSAFASRGQQRTAVLALLFLEVSYLELQRGEKPVVLLDDVFSELDQAHQERLLSTLRDCQVLITTTHLPAGALHPHCLYEVGGGKISEATRKRAHA
ncbi:MAG: DNA replication and repair protein RecF [Candidatus Peribacteraceae bacterium]|nr:DNA replication and repair protein RecF [Candidatus Peribacteraceae bacterium]